MAYALYSSNPALLAVHSHIEAYTRITWWHTDLYLSIFELLQKANPAPLKNVLETINSIRTKNETLITVVGCGGDRDKSKRPRMAHIASALSTKIIYTSDNPRSENPDQIISEMEGGVEAQNFKKTISITNRKQAIKTACQLAEPNDIILVAGKGHETYQEVNGIKSEFNDYKITEEFLKQLKK